MTCDFTHHSPACRILRPPCPATSATLPTMVWKHDPEPRWLRRLKAAAVVLVPLFIVGLAVWDAC